MIFRRQFSNRTRGFGHPVDLNMRTLQRRHRRYECLVGDGRRPVHNRTHRRKVTFRLAGLRRNKGHEPQQRWDIERVRGFLVVHEVQQRGRIWIAHQEGFCPDVHTGQRPARTTNMEQRHCGNVLRRGIHSPRSKHIGHQLNEVGIGRHHAFRQSGGPRCVELEGNVGFHNCNVGVGCWKCSDPVVVARPARVLAKRHDLSDSGQLALNSLNRFEEVNSDDQHLCFSVVDCVRDLRASTAPVHRYVDDVSLRAAKENLEILQTIFFEKGNSLLGTDSGRNQSIGHLRRTGIHLRPRGDRSFHLHTGGGTLFFRICADDIGCRQHGLYAPVVSRYSGRSENGSFNFAIWRPVRGL